MEPRYLRNLPLLGESGQEKLKAAKVLVVGAGGLGCPVLQYLTAAGIGTIGICDGDVVQPSNLNRQVLYGDAALGQKKAVWAKERLQQLNPHLNVQVYAQLLTAENADSLCQSYDIMVDCLDNLAARLLLNDICVKQRKPLVHGAVSQYFGQQMTILPGTPCLRCIFPDDSVAETQKESPENGIIGAVAGVIGSIQALEVIKLIVGKPCNVGVMTYYDLLYQEVDKIEIKAKQDCICQK